MKKKYIKKLIKNTHTESKKTFELQLINTSPLKKKQKEEIVKTLKENELIKISIRKEGSIYKINAILDKKENIHTILKNIQNELIKLNNNNLLINQLKIFKKKLDKKQFNRLTQEKKQLLSPLILLNIINKKEIGKKI